MTAKTTLLCVMDGFGLNPNAKANAVHMAKKPRLDDLFERCPRTTLITHGEAVGLPEGQMGNSEVGHLNIGAGRVVEQWLLRISRALKGPFLDNNAEYQSFKKGCSQSGTLHLIGLVSDGGVHSHIDHLMLLIDRLRADLRCKIAIHVITDGRDTAPNSAAGYVAQIERKIQALDGVFIATVSGRFFAMDRDKRWERTAQAYRAIGLSDAPRSESPQQAIVKSHELGKTDEFIEPVVISPAPISDDDSLLFWNFREDRMRQMVRVLCVGGIPEIASIHRLPPPSRVLCFTEYDHSFKLPFLFPILDISNHLGAVVAGRSLPQLRVAETEKYPHVTYFFNGGIEKELPLEERKLVPSPRDVKTYDLKPEMSAAAVTDIVVDAIESGRYALIVVNLANCDMVGHTGVLEAAIKAVETVDKCVGRMFDALQKSGGQALIIADHGNAEQMLDYETGAPHTAHTKYPVPAILVGRGAVQLREGGALCDVAPTILKMMDIPQPPEMTGRALF